MEVGPVGEEGAESGQQLNTTRHLQDTLVQIRLHPPLFYMKALQLNQPFFSDMANHSLFNTNPNDPKFSWVLIQPNVINSDSHIMTFVSKARN